MSIIYSSSENTTTARVNPHIIYSSEQMFLEFASHLFSSHFLFIGDRKQTLNRLELTEKKNGGWQWRSVAFLCGCSYLHFTIHDGMLPERIFIQTYFFP